MKACRRLAKGLWLWGLEESFGFGKTGGKWISHTHTLLEEATRSASTALDAKRAKPSGMQVDRNATGFALCDRGLALEENCNRRPLYGCGLTSKRGADNKAFGCPGRLGVPLTLRSSCFSCHRTDLFTSNTSCAGRWLALLCVCLCALPIKHQS